MLYDATAIVRIDRKTGKEISTTYTNIRPSTGSLEDYLAPAVEYLAKVLRRDAHACNQDLRGDEDS